MKALGSWLVVIAVGLTACSSALPPGARVTDVSTLAGTYWGTVDETGMMSRQVKCVVLPDGSFEISAGEPAGFRYNGHMVVDSADGTLVYQYDRGKGRAVVHDGDGRRAIVFNRADGRETIRVDRPLP
jgi:hypothetical protein